MLGVSQAVKANQKTPPKKVCLFGARCIQESADITVSIPSETHSSRTAVDTWAGLTGVWVRLAAGMVSGSVRGDPVASRHLTHIGVILGDLDVSTLASGGALK